jgi:hypothetical protein
MKRLLASIGLILTLLAAAPMGVSQAYNVLPASDCQGAAASSAVCEGRNNKTNPLIGANGLFGKIANIVALIAGVAAVIIIILAGLRLVQSGGSSEDVAGARRAILYAIIGLIVIVLARALIGLALNAI